RCDSPCLLRIRVSTIRYQKIDRADCRNAQWTTLTRRPIRLAIDDVLIIYEQFQRSGITAVITIPFLENAPSAGKQLQQRTQGTLSLLPDKCHMQRLPLSPPVWTHTKQQAIKSAGEKKRISSMMQFDTLLDDRHLDRRPGPLPATH